MRHQLLGKQDILQAAKLVLTWQILLQCTDCFELMMTLARLLKDWDILIGYSLAVICMSGSCTARFPLKLYALTLCRHFFGWALPFYDALLDC